MRGAAGVDEAVAARGGGGGSFSRPSGRLPSLRWAARDPQGASLTAFGRETSRARRVGTSRGPRNFLRAASHDRAVDACHPLLRSGPPASSVPRAAGAPRSFLPVTGRALRIDLPSLPANRPHVREARSVRHKCQRVPGVENGLRHVQEVVLPSDRRKSRRVRGLARRVREVALRNARRRAQVGGPRSFPPSPARE